MAKKALTYKKTTTTTLKAEGFLDVEAGTIEIDGNVTPVTDLLGQFTDDDHIEIVIRTKLDEELELEPNE
jgi:hypothetical protein